MKLLYVYYGMHIIFRRRLIDGGQVRYVRGLFFLFFGINNFLLHIRNKMLTCGPLCDKYSP